MLKQKTLEDLIREKVFLGGVSGSGWYYLNCPLCGDSRLRGGFKFDGDNTGYSCWNCSAKFKYEEGSGKLSKNAKEILEACGVSREDLQELTSPSFLKKAEEPTITIDNLTKVKTHTPEVAFPDRSHPLLSSVQEDMQAPILEYLLARQIDPLKTTFYFSLDPKFFRRVIIPYWRDGKLIYWQARTIDEGVKPRYRNCEIAKDAVIYGYDKLFTHENSPLFVTEGVFNAIMVDGISVMGATLNASKIELLKKTKRRLIFVRDRDSQGDVLSKQALENGWEITTVDKRVNDINESVTTFGLPYTAYSLISNAQRPSDKLQSSVSLDIWGLEDRLRKR